VTSWVGSISFEQRDNWDICKQRSLFGSNTVTALGVRAGDELFIWGSKQGWLARCRITEDARRPRGVEEVPWPEPERYTALIPIEVVDEPATPLFMSGPDIEQTVGIGTIQLPRFPRVDVHHAQQLTVLLSESFGHGSSARGLQPAQPSSPSATTEDPLLGSLDELKVDRQLGKPAPYQQLVLLWAIAEAVRGRERLRAFSEARDELRALLAPFAVGVGQPDPELPWFALRKSRWWQLFGAPDGPVSRGGRDFVRSEDPVAGLARLVHDRVRDDAAFRARAVELLTVPLGGHPALQSTLTSLFPATPSGPTASVGPEEAQEAIDLLSELMGRRLVTTTGAVNTILAVEPPDVLVATSRSPQGQRVLIADVQKGLNLLRRDGKATVDVPTLGHRSSFIGAVLAAQNGVTVSGSPPVVSLLDAPRGRVSEITPDAGAVAQGRLATERFFGELPGVPVGSAWMTRAEASHAGVHRPTQSGISGTRAEGSDSIVVNGGYEDDVDEGDEMIYTGAGANDAATGKQIADQTLDYPGNAGLVTSQNQGLPVRVIRGFKGDPEYSPDAGYRYDGLYRVVDHWSKLGKSRFRIWQFRLVRISAHDAAPYVPEENVPIGNPTPRTSSGVTTRVVRDTKVSRFVKKLYGDACQVCGVRLEIPGGSLSEGAHVRALGRPHFGPDIIDNVLCLCPNHHTLFDEGGICVSDDLNVYDHQGHVIGTLAKHAKHAIDVAHLQYHRGLWGY
jgi:predicted restriction endonuclease